MKAERDEHDRRMKAEPDGRGHTFPMKAERVNACPSMLISPKPEWGYS